MATTYNFEDRFSYPDLNGPAVGVSKDTAQTLSAEDLLEISPELNEMVRMVRAYSVLLQRTSPLTIFNIITSEADPRIALVLAAAKSKLNNQPLFGGLGAVKELMYADPQRPGQTLYTNRNLFSDGIRRVSAALTASRILGQLAQVKEQADHSALIEKQALDDLDRIIITWELNNTSNEASSLDNEDTAPTVFYFEPKQLTIPAEKTLVVEWQSPGISAVWESAGVYTGAVETWQIVNDIAADINAKSVNNPDNILLAAAELSGPYFTNRVNANPAQYHVLRFYPRNPERGVFAYSLNIRVNVVLNEGATDASTVAFPVNRAPFIWGIYSEALNNYIVNGLIIAMRDGKLSALNNAEKIPDYEPFVLYFRNGVTYTAGTTTPPPAESKLVYRIQPWQQLGQDSVEEEDYIQTIEVSVPRLLSDDPEQQAFLDNNRFSQVTLALANSLTEIEIDAYLAGAIIRNDPITVSTPTSAIELVPWARQRIISAVVLDILEVPPDVDIATGNRTQPITVFASKPRSGIVKNPYTDKSSLLLLTKEVTYVSPRRRSDKWSMIQDEAKSVLRGGYHW